MTEAVAILVQFLSFALPRLPALFPVARDFWGANDHLGPLPPAIEAWAHTDAAVDAELAKRRKVSL